MEMVLVFVIGAGAVVRDLDKLDIERAGCGGCEYCCLSTLKCGSLSQCRDRVRLVWVMEGFFWVVAAMAMYVVVRMCLNKAKSVNLKD